MSSSIERVLATGLTGILDTLAIEFERMRRRGLRQPSLRQKFVARNGVHMRVAARIAATVALLACGCALAELRPTVIELYTAEGCSSCPPAEALLGDIANSSTVIALALHVDYWDKDGWPDKYALRAATERQNQYAHALRHSFVVTPQFVIDGVRAIDGTDRSAITTAARSTPAGIPLQLSIADARLRVALGADAKVLPCEVVLFAYLPRAGTAVAHGENAGRTLKEFNIVRAMVHLGDWNGHEQSLDVPLTQLPPDATQVAVIVQQVGLGPIVGSARIALR
jgi:hypothetical protein